MRRIFGFSVYSITRLLLSAFWGIQKRDQSQPRLYKIEQYRPLWFVSTRRHTDLPFTFTKCPPTSTTHLEDKVLRGGSLHRLPLISSNTRHMEAEESLLRQLGIILGEKGMERAQKYSHFARNYCFDRTLNHSQPLTLEEGSHLAKLER